MKRSSPGKLGVFLILAATLGAGPAPPPEIQRVERGLQPAVLLKGEKTWTIEERMRLHKVPAVSIAVFGSGKILWAKAYGLADADALSAATDTTLFQAASVSKPVSAMAALREVERGKLALDRNINDYLKSWKLPENDWTRKKPVTLAMLLSHSAGVTVHGFPGYAAGRAVPLLSQILDGVAPANTAPIRVDIAPATEFRYSGGGYTIVQQALIDVEGKSYPQILSETVLAPLAMTQSTCEQPLPPERLRSAAAGHDGQGRPIPGKRHTYPEMAAAGLWTTPSDLARFALGLEGALEGKPGGVLSKEMAAKMVTPGFGGVGLGLAIVKRDAASYFSHGGSNEGFRCLLLAHKEKGYGAVVMTNSESGDEILPEIMRSIAAAYQWEGYRNEPVEPAKMDARVTLQKNFELIPISADTFLRTDAEAQYKFAKDASGREEIVIAPQQGEARTGKRIAETVRVPAEELEAGKFDAAAAGYQRLRDTNPSDPSVAEGRLNALGYALLSRNEFKGAIAVFRVNSQLYPDSANTYDSLAEAHMKAGDRKQAIALYRKALETLPRDRSPESVKEGVRASATAKLKELGVDKP